MHPIFADTAALSDPSGIRHFVAHRRRAWAGTFRGQDVSHELLATGQALAAVGEDEVVKRTTAIRHLVEMGEEASDLLRLRDSDVGWPLEEIWVTGELLDANGDLDAGSVILLLDVAPAELPWLAMHQAGEWVGERLRLGKRPMLWCYRPAVFPPWNARHRRVARVWSAATGLDDEMIESLRSGRRPSIVEPSEQELRDQLVEERAGSRAHLRQMVDEYWEPEWRRRHRGEEREDYLWRAASGLIEIEEALALISD